MTVTLADAALTYTVAVFVLAYVVLRPRGHDGRPLLGTGRGFIDRNIVLPAVLGLGAVGLFAAGLWVAAWLNDS